MGKGGKPKSASRNRSSTPRETNARGLAYDVLCRCDREGEFAARVLDGALAHSLLSPADRRLATELTYGVVRRKITLDALLAPFVRRGRDSIEDDLWMLLRLGAYQLVLLSNVPARAAVNETVNIAAAIGKQRWTGFANGILRALARAIQDETTEAPADNAVPLAGGRYRLLDQHIFPAPAQEPAGYFAAAFGFNDWLATRWLQRVGFDELLRLGFWFNTPTPISLRVNTLKTERDAMLQSLRQADVAAQPGDCPATIRLEGFARVQDLPGYTDGLFTVQDESATAAALLLAPQPGQQVLDMCAAPGGKTTHLAELMQNSGHIVAADIHRQRLQLVTSACVRLGINVVEATPIGPDLADLPCGPFDAILVDVPCSNTGVLGKRPEARLRQSSDNLNELRALQERLLRAALHRLATCGRLVYSTCSIEPEENRSVIETVLPEFPTVRLTEEIHHSPGNPADGGYQALLQR